ncbi:TIGR04282 family arsenosugar biosynthesis glycosyltransferase [Clostridium tagluense]|uniref:TIGR04282 family arsenosugar biosynthesis glycosyltransferase n=2 Tax=Clostridium tagluense TaxID=360422 RepID=UPI001C0B650B|nr:TIGR04282 family arsenosugar biosynthesis glycosyltransferase [Clostridium tagluense]MBU3129903.1 TIGR04282 family arsenosugar biosynthesis glycosyltransferase [Clostridium tagluense]MCB2313533.1 TIGR04282 family arsenosugar biosynthesis glycosyltransferase [Clostridium tagluense]MCB2318411.1 TIGR04282 family arsenosugar biosynthesis glycosyltransferase [Clostridium tagluense]MCB2323212.1 TIGR04282 family arsenosugar biosynthesis glycosyltransferase [Clostridium tagluense]MCB2328141.1 TIGR0
MNALILMTRIPIAGMTKTRLMKVLTGEECAEIHRCFLLDLFKMVSELRQIADIYVTYTPENSLYLMADIIPSFIDSFPQKGYDIGERMDNSIQKLLNKGYSKVILIGSDIPSLQSEDIKKAYEELEDKDICIGPTNDGGYYLVGMKKRCRDIFSSNLKWGYKSVFEATVSIANNLGLKVGLVAKLSDIDEKEDIEDFMKRIQKEEFKVKTLPINTVNFIQNRWGGGINVKRYVK